MLSKWETLFLLLLTIPIMGHVVMLPILLDVAGRDVWISVLLALPAAVLFAFAIYRLRVHYPNTGVSDMLGQLIGKWPGRAVKLLLILYFTFLMVLSFAALVDVTNIVFLPSTPHWAILGWFWIFAVYAAAKGIKRIALTAGVLTFIAIIAGHLITIMDAGKKEWGHLLPFLEFGWSPVLVGSLIIVSVWMELLLLLCIPIKNIYEKRFFLIWVIGIFLNSLMIISTATGVVTIFGMGQADNFVYPAAEIVRIISIGFLDRVDVYALIVMTFGSYIRCSLYLRIAYEMSVAKKTSKWIKRPIFALFALTAFFASLYLANVHYRMDGAINVYTYMIVLFPLPFIMLWISRRKRRKVKMA